jgi:hypothetical protein
MPKPTPDMPVSPITPVPKPTPSPVSVNQPPSSPISVNQPQTTTPVTAIETTEAQPTYEVETELQTEERRIFEAKREALVERGATKEEPELEFLKPEKPEVDKEQELLDELRKQLSDTGKLSDDKIDELIARLQENEYFKDMTRAEIRELIKDIFPVDDKSYNTVLEIINGFVIYKKQGRTLSEETLKQANIPESSYQKMQAWWSKAFETGGEYPSFAQMGMTTSFYDMMGLPEKEAEVVTATITEPVVTTTAVIPTSTESTTTSELTETQRLAILAGIQKVFPDREVSEVWEYYFGSTDDMERTNRINEFLTKVAESGKSDETVSLIKSIWTNATDETVTSIFDKSYFTPTVSTGITTEQTTSQKLADLRYYIDYASYQMQMHKYEMDEYQKYIDESYKYYEYKNDPGYKEARDELIANGWESYTTETASGTTTMWRKPSDEYLNAIKKYEKAKKLYDGYEKTLKERQSEYDKLSEQFVSGVSIPEITTNVSYTTTDLLPELGTEFEGGVVTSITTDPATGLITINTEYPDGKGAGKTYWYVEQDGKYVKTDSSGVAQSTSQSFITYLIEQSQMAGVGAYEKIGDGSYKITYPSGVAYIKYDENGITIIPVPDSLAYDMYTKSGGFIPAGTPEYDAYVAQLKAIDDGFYMPDSWWIENARNKSNGLDYDRILDQYSPNTYTAYSAESQGVLGYGSELYERYANPEETKVTVEYDPTKLSEELQQTYSLLYEKFQNFGNIQTALTGGMTEEQLKLLGISQSQIELSKYGTVQEAIEAGVPESTLLEAGVPTVELNRIGYIESIEEKLKPYEISVWNEEERKLETSYNIDAAYEAGVDLTALEFMFGETAVTEAGERVKMSQEDRAILEPYMTVEYEYNSRSRGFPLTKELIAEGWEFVEGQDVIRRVKSTSYDIVQAIIDGVYRSVLERQFGAFAVANAELVAERYTNQKEQYLADINTLGKYVESAKGTEAYYDYNTYSQGLELTPELIAEGWERIKDDNPDNDNLIRRAKPELLEYLSSGQAEGVTYDSVQIVQDVIVGKLDSETVDRLFGTDFLDTYQPAIDAIGTATTPLEARLKGVWSGYIDLIWGAGASADAQEKIDEAEKHIIILEVANVITTNDEGESVIDIEQAVANDISYSELETLAGGKLSITEEEYNQYKTQQTALNSLANYTDEEGNPLYVSIDSEGNTLYDVNAFITNNPTEEAIQILKGAGFKEDVINDATEYVSSAQEVLERLNDTLSGIQGFSDKQILAIKAEELGLLEKAYQIKGIESGVYSREQSGLGTVGGWVETPEEGNWFTDLFLGAKPDEYNIIDYNAFLDSLSEEDKLQLAGAMGADPNISNAFASSVSRFNYEFAKLPEIAQIGMVFVPEIGMPLMAGQMVSTTIAKATTGQKVTALEIAVDAAATALAVLTHIPVKTLPAKLTAKTIEVGAVGTFATQFAVSYEDMSVKDRYINGAMMLIPAIGWSAGLRKAIKTKALEGSTEAPIKVAERQKAILDKVIQVNKDIINETTIKDPEIRKQAEIKADAMQKNVSEYADTAFELAQTRKAISDMGLAKSKGELDILEKLQIKEKELNIRLIELENPLKLSIKEYNDIISNAIKYDDPLILTDERIKNLPDTMKRELDSIANEIVNPRNAIDVYKDTQSVNKQIEELENSIKRIDLLSVEEIKSIESLIQELKSQIMSLNKEARLLELAGETVKVEGKNITTEIKSLQSKLVEANNELVKAKKQNIELEIEKVKTERDIFEAMENIYDPLFGKESYAKELNILNEKLDNLISTMKDFGISEKVAVNSGFKIYDAIIKQDSKILKEAIEQLQLEAGKITDKMLQLKAGEEIKLLAVRAEDLMSSYKFTGQKIPKSEYETVYEPKSIDTSITREAEHIYQTRYEKLIRTIPESRRTPEEIMDYLREKYDSEYFESTYEGRYKDIDDFLDVDRIEQEIRNQKRRYEEELIDIKRDIDIHEKEVELADIFKKKETLNKETRDIVEERSNELQRQLEEKKRKLQLAEKEALSMPLEKTRSTEEPVKIEESLVTSEKALMPKDKAIEKLVEEIESEASARKAVEEASAELERRAKEGESLFGIKTKPKISDYALPETKTEHIGAMTPEQKQRLYGVEEEQFIDARSPYIRSIPDIDTYIKTSPTIIPEPEPISIPTPETVTIPEPTPITEPITTPIVAPIQEPLTIPETKIQELPKEEIKTEPVTKIVEVPKEQIKEEIKETKTGIIPSVLDWDEEEVEKWKKEGFPAGTITWKQGMFWKVIPPPYDKDRPISMFDPPKDAVNTDVTGEGTAYKTLQILGDKVPKDVRVDLGWTDVYITTDIETKKPRIQYLQGGLETNVGSREPSNYKGMTITGEPSSKDTPKEQYTSKDLRRSPYKKKALSLSEAMEEEPETKISYEPKYKPRQPSIKRTNIQEGTDLDRYYLGHKLPDSGLEVQI